MIRLLLALHPRSWRARYGQEFRALLEAEPVTAAVVLDVLRNAARQHVRAHATASQVLAALVISLAVEVVAVHAGVTDNILWPPSTPLRALTLAAVLVPWLSITVDLAMAVRRRLSAASRLLAS